MWMEEETLVETLKVNEEETLEEALNVDGGGNSRGGPQGGWRRKL